MLFSSTIFLFAFLPVVVSTYLLLRGTTSRNALLLGASLVFYAWGEPRYIALLFLSIGANFAFGLWIDRRRGRSQRLALTTAVTANLALLGSFKYANFIADSVNALLLPLGLPALHLDPVHLPIGISFFTFQALTYVVDVYRRDAPVERNPFHVALYLSLFPQLIAGPIVRYRQIASQLRAHNTSAEDVAVGVRRFTIGLGKKVLIANTLAVPADRIFAIPTGELQMSVAWLGAVCYALQIYFDFSGYSDMAIGLGRIFGFHFPENFLHPYASRSIREFWRRWHITLSSWFRDYLYIPLGGSRRGGARTHVNLFAVFVLCGLWHGASWNFVVWGLLHGTLIVAERLGQRTLVRIPAPIARAYTLSFVTLAWVFFRADDLGHATDFVAALFSPGTAPSSPHLLPLFLDSRVALMLVLAAIGSTPWLPALRERVPDRARWLEASGRFIFLNAVLVACAMALASGTHNPFIYFRF